MSSEADEAQPEEIINVNFVALEPHEEDFFGIKSLLRQLVLRAGVNISALAELLIQDKEAIVVKTDCDDDDDDDDAEGEGEDCTKPSAAKSKSEEPAPAAAAAAGAEPDDEDDALNVFAVMGLLGLGKKADCVKELLAWLTSNCSDPATKKQWSQLIDAPTTACLVSERFINIPAQLAVPMFQTLVTPPEGKGKAPIAPYKHIIMICKKVAEPPTEEQDDDKPRKKRRRANFDFQFRHPEEEEFAKLATLSFSFRVQAVEPDEEGPQDLRHERCVLVLPVKGFKQAVAAISNEYSAPVDFAH